MRIPDRKSASIFSSYPPTGLRHSAGWRFGAELSKRNTGFRTGASPNDADVAQNRGQESLTTTLGSYGKVGPHEQGEVLRNAGKTSDDSKLDRLMALVERIQPQ